MLPRLPSYPINIDNIINDSSCSSYSRKLNILFSFTAIGVQGQFVTLLAPSTVCIMGRTYHRMLPINTPNHSLNWYIYDEQERYIIAQKQKIPNDWVSTIRTMLTQVNPYISWLRTFQRNFTYNTILELQENSSTGKIAAIMHADNIVNIHPRSIIIWCNTDIMPRFISIFSSQYEPLQYPLLFPHGTPGWHIKNNYNLSQIDWYRYRLLQEQRFLKFGRLTSEYLVDIDFKDEIDENEEENLHLSASFLGSKRWCSSHVANALALARSLGKPSFFITMTTNPNWKEIHSQLQPGQNALEITPIVVHSFHSRFKKLKKLIRTYFGKVIYIIEVIEFQKRGFPHAHVIVCVQPELSINQIDKIIIAELPREKSPLRELVEKYMIHKQQHLPHCLRNRKCIYNYPKPIIPETHVNEKGFVQYRHHMQEDLWVVPYNPMLISKLEYHINFEIASTINLFMYLFKYLFKGPDYVKFAVNSKNTSESKNYNRNDLGMTSANSMPNQHINGFEDYINGRYLSATEAAWRIFRYSITMSDPSVLALPIHLPNTNIPQYTRYQNISSSVSLLDHYFLRPLDSFFTQLKYTEYYENYILYPFNPNTIHEDNFVEQEHPNVLKKTVQKRTTNKITRIVLIAPGAEVAREMGLFANKSESILTIKEAINNFYTPAQLRFLFTQLMLDGAPSLELWEQYENNFSADYQEQLHGNHSLATNMTLQEIASMLAEHG
ncbi:8124_t:CDS:2, partial [Gigaspora margarita]